MNRSAEDQRQLFHAVSIEAKSWAGALDWAACNVAKLRRGFSSEEALRKLFVAMLMACTKYSSENPSSQHAS